MDIRRIGIILNGVTGRMGTNQHLLRSIGAIIRQGGIRVSDQLTLIPDPILTGRSENKLKALAETHGRAITGNPFKYTTDVPGALDGKYGNYDIFFDASGTLQRVEFVDMAIRAGKAIYCEKPIATCAQEAYALADRVEKAGLKNGVVQDKLWLPGFRKIRMLRDQGYFGRILSVRGEFGYWVFSGEIADQPAQRPSWNYRAADGGGIILDMFCHWQYLIGDLFGPIRSLVVHASIDQTTRVDEARRRYTATADDSAYAIFQLDNGVTCQFNSSWCTRVRRDDLLTVQVDGTGGSAVATLREAYVQHISETPRPVWNPDIDQPVNFFDGWQKVPSAVEYDNAFKIQWELFIRHVALDEPWSWPLRKGADGVKLAEAALDSWKEKRWVEL